MKADAPNNLLSLDFSVGHDCSRDFDDGDWQDFIPLEASAEFFVFECPKCKTHACISVDIQLSAKAKSNPKRSAAKVAPAGPRTEKKIKREGL
jgi:hypothetical protein